MQGRNKDAKVRRTCDCEIGMREWDELGDWDRHFYITMSKIDAWWETVVWHKGLAWCSVMTKCGRIGGGVGERSKKEGIDYTHS